MIKFLLLMLFSGITFAHDNYKQERYIRQPNITFIIDFNIPPAQMYWRKTDNEIYYNRNYRKRKHYREHYIYNRRHKHH